MKKFILGISLIAIAVACATNPLTGRKSLSLVSNNQLFPQAFAQYSQVMQQSEVDKTSADAKMINEVGQRLKYAAEKFYADAGLSEKLQGYEWEFSLIKNNELNAWCMPGGKVAFYTGILPVCKNETGIAVVMGHEITHALAGHSAEQMSQGIVAQYGGALIGASISNDKIANIFNQFYPVGAKVGLLSYNRKMELDSDKGGLFLMAIAGYDPREAAKFWQRMAKASESKETPPQFLSTHPNPANRIADINANLAKAMEYYNASPYKGK